MHVSESTAIGLAQLLAVLWLATLVGGFPRGVFERRRIDVPGIGLRDVYVKSLGIRTAALYLFISSTIATVAAIMVDTSIAMALPVTGDTWWFIVTLLNSLAVASQCGTLLSKVLQHLHAAATDEAGQQPDEGHESNG